MWKGTLHHLLLLLPLILNLCYCSVAADAANADAAAADVVKVPCQKDKLVVYKVIFSTYWSEENFPRQYPEWRPPAQWSKLVGKLFRFEPGQ